MIPRVASVLCSLAVDAHPSDGATMTNSQSALWGPVSYNTSGEMMAAISWLLLFPFLFSLGFL
jgi:hypothetical protein